MPSDIFVSGSEMERHCARCGAVLPLAARDSAECENCSPSLGPNRLRKTIANLGNRFWFPLYNLCWYLYVKDQGSDSLNQYLTKNIAVNAISTSVRASVPLVPLPFWHVIFLITLWYPVGAWVDFSLPLETDKTRFPKRLLIAVVAAYVGVCYDISFMLGHHPILTESSVQFEASAISLLIESIAQFMRLTFFGLIIMSSVRLAERRVVERMGLPLLPYSDSLPQIKPYTLREIKAWILSLQRWHFITVACVAWVLGCMVVQERSVFVHAVVFLATALYLLRWLFPSLRNYRWAVLGLLPLVLVLSEAGSYKLWRDLLFLFVGFCLAFLFWFRSLGAGTSRLQLKSGGIFILTTWLLWSTGDALWPPPAARLQPSRFTGLRQSSAYKDKRVGIALSGGGYRAALVQAGILAGLEKLQMPVTNISSVSGGSIIAAFYAAGGTPEEFLLAMQQQKSRIFRDVVDVQNFARLILSVRIPGTRVRLFPFYDFSRTDLESEVLDRLFLRGKKFSDLKDDEPKLMICVTDLYSGRAVGLSQDWTLTRFLLHPPGEQSFPNTQELYAGGQRMEAASNFGPPGARTQKLSQLVAASGAFPLAFPPVRFTGSGPLSSFLMADGGVTDNSGMTLLLEADRRASLKDPREGDKDWSLDLAISADGGAMFTQDQTVSEEAFTRAIDIIDARIGLEPPSDKRGSERPTAPPTVLLSPTLYLDNSQPAYDYSHLRFSMKDAGIVNFATIPDAKALDPEQKRLVMLFEKQIENLDSDSLSLLSDIVSQPYKSKLIEPSPPASYSDFVSDLLLPRRHKQSPDDGTQNTDELRQIQQGDYVNIEIITPHLATDFASGLETFLSTPTLQDAFDPEDAQELYRLGEYLVLLNAHEIRERLAGHPLPTILEDDRKGELRCNLQSEVKFSLRDGGRDVRREDPVFSNRANELDACMQHLSMKPKLRP
jgi:predicted acylesterase/phospholipase RssA